ncbi:MAG: glycosyltransferase family 87 protein [Pseudomonadota bacterium]
MEPAPPAPGAAHPLRPGWSWRGGLAWLALLVGLVCAGLVLGGRDSPLRRPDAAAVDAMPLLLGARALLAGGDPSDDAALEEAYRRSEDIAFPVHGFHSYYPPTASLLFLPMGLLPCPWLAALLYWGSLAALVGSAWFLATAGRGRGHVAGLAAALLVGAVFLKLRVTPVVLRVGQVSPFVVLLTAVALWGLARARTWGLWAFTLGAALKYFPLLLLPAALAARRWRWLLAAGGLAVGLVAALWIWRDSPHGLRPPWLFGAGHFFTDAPVQPWARHGPPWLLWLWRLRLPLLGGSSAAVVVATAWARPGRELSVATGGLLLAFGGALTAGGHLYHESILCLPALGLVLAWPAQRGPLALQWGGAALALAALVFLGALDPAGPPNPPHWLPISYLVWTLCLLRWGWAWWWERFFFQRHRSE